MRLWAVLLLVGMLAACGGGVNQSTGSFVRTSPSSELPTTQTPSAAAPAVPAGSEIVISNFSYTVPASVRPGQQVTVVNKDEANHTVTADQNGLFDVRVSGGGGFSTFSAPSAPGAYPFHCNYHDNMHGTLTVQ
jgi:plastocyanin